MTGTGFSLLAGGAVLALIPSIWGYLRAFYAQFAGRIVVRAIYRGNLASAVSYYLVHSMKPSRFGIREFMAEFSFIRPLLRRGLVAVEAPGAEPRIYWHGWRPVLISREQNKNGDPNGAHWNPLTVSFLRGTFDPEQLAIAAAEKYNDVRQRGNAKRYFIRYMTGTEGEMRVDSGQPVGPPTCGTFAEENPLLLSGRILRWKLEEIGDRDPPGEQMGRLALSDEVEHHVAMIEQWSLSESWYRERGIPWRRGCLFCGPPGTGKTATVRALAQKLDLPIFVFDLPTLRNRELRNAWLEARSCTPCIALFEDIDCVFEGRKNIAGTSLTFDAFLNCLDGVQESAGMLVIATSNRPETIDPALGSASGNNGSSRPGRIDCFVEFEALTTDGRWKLCRRILRDWPELWDKTVADGEGETGAQFQERCCIVASDATSVDR